MIRIVIVMLALIAAWVLMIKLVKELKSANVDWTGVAFMVGFVVVAFWLRHVTGLG